MDKKQYAKLPRAFYVDPDVVKIAQKLLGKVVFTHIDGIFTAGRIVETEAYCGRNDRACHAFARRTARTEVMYGPGGQAYVYLCYGIHHLFNIVTNEAGLADAVLVRAVEPLIGLEEMQQRRGCVVPARLTKGPGTLSQALGIHTRHTGTDLLGDSIWIAEELHAKPFEMETDVRIGVDYAGEDALLPWRFLIKDSPWVSVKKKSPTRN